MAEYSMQPSPSQSFIPVVTPRPSRSSISNAFPTSQVSLGSQPRRTSESSTQASPASTSVSLGPQTPVSSIPTFRSFRNLLPFGPGKTSNPPAASPANIPKSSFVNFGSLRRSITNERKASATYNRRDESEVSPVIAIARSSETFEEEMMAHKRSRDLVRSTSDFSPSSRASSTVTEERYVLPAPSPGPPLGADLSTIIEAENSGISKHIPCPEDTTHSDSDGGSPVSPFRLEQNDRSRLPSPDSREESVFELSTSKLTAEVMDALMVKDATTASDWLQGVNGVVVEESTDDPPKSSRGVRVANCRGEKDPDATFDFGALDPDLAELLSPNRVNGKSPFSTPVGSLLPTRAHSRSPSHPLAPSSRGPADSDGISPHTSPRLGNIIPPSPASRAVAQSSPTRRTVSLSRANLARAPASSLPRLMRSVTNAPPSGRSSPEEPSTSPGLRGPPKKRHQPPSPLSSHAHSSQTGSHKSPRGSADLPTRRPGSSRLATPNRHVSSCTPINCRIADAPTTFPPPDSDSASPVSQLSSRTASDHRRQPHSRPSLDFGGPLEVNKRRRAHLFYNRKRSMSVEETRLSPTSASSGASLVRPSSSLSNRPPAMEWLGPRTVKAFAAAGLLDGDRDNAPTAGTGRYASLRAGSEREERYVPSRTAFSEAPSSSSWGRGGSVSRGMTPSESGVTWAGSPTFSAPRTTFSGGSTAPTSISVSSSAQQATIQLMREKHDLETEALLSALSDSQRTTKTLREENLQLHDRIRELEDQLDVMRDQIHRLASGVPPPRPPQATFLKSMLDRTITPPAPLVVSRRPTMQRSLSHVHATITAKSSLDLNPQRHVESSSHIDPLPRTRQRRASTTSSVFPNLPSNMSMLMLEETMHDRAAALSTASVSPPSPTLGLPRRSSSIKRGHNHQTSISSAGNISPMTANFSMTEIPGSPNSLQLRPEHELHLGDMASLSLYAMSDEEGQSYDP